MQLRYIAGTAQGLIAESRPDRRHRRLRISSGARTAQRDRASDIVEREMRQRDALTRLELRQHPVEGLAGDPQRKQAGRPTTGRARNSVRVQVVSAGAASIHATLTMMPSAYHLGREIPEIARDGLDRRINSSAISAATSARGSACRPAGAGRPPKCRCTNRAGHCRTRGMDGPVVDGSSNVAPSASL